jgi:hypothetical protein
MATPRFNQGWLQRLQALRAEANRLSSRVREDAGRLYPRLRWNVRRMHPRVWQRTVVLNRARSQMDALRSLSILPARERRDIEHAFRQHQLHIIPFRIWRARVEFLGAILFGIALFSTLLVPAFYTSATFYDPDDLVQVVLVGLLPIGVLLVITLCASFFIRPFFTFAEDTVLYGGAVICALLAYWIFSKQGSPTVVWQVIGIAAVGYAILAAVVLIASLLGVIVESIFWHLESDHYPSAVVVDAIFATTCLVEAEKRNHRRSGRFNHRLSARMEEIAVRLERDMRRQLRSGDGETDEWLASQCKEMAAAVRALKRDVFRFTTDARQHMERELIKMLSAAALGNWERFPRVPAEALTRPEKIRRLVESAKVLVRAGLPFLILWLIQQTSLSFEGRDLIYAKAATIAWSVLTLLAFLDPLFEAKISSMSSLTGMLSAARPKKE